MAKLSSQEQAMLRRLQEKSEAPDSGPIGRSVSVNIDLGDPKQVARAIKMGLLDDDSDFEDEGSGDGDDEEADETPKRRSYFKDKS